MEASLVQIVLGTEEKVKIAKSLFDKEQNKMNEEKEVMSNALRIAQADASLTNTMRLQVCYN